MKTLITLARVALDLTQTLCFTVAAIAVMIGIVEAVRMVVA